MKGNISNIIKDVTNRTIEGTIVWMEIENTYCLKAEYQNKPIVICRYPDFETKKKIASFNFLNEENYIIEPNNQWLEDEDGYDIISNLYNKACETLPSYSCE